MDKVGKTLWKKQNNKLTWSVTWGGLFQRGWLGKTMRREHLRRGEALFKERTCVRSGRGGRSLGFQTVKNVPATWGTWVQSLGQENPLEEGMATHSRIPAWRIPWTEEPGGYSPWGHKESDTTECLRAAQHRRRVWLSRKWRTKEPLDESKREWKSWLRTQPSEI